MQNTTHAQYSYHINHIIGIDHPKIRFIISVQILLLYYIPPYDIEYTVLSFTHNICHIGKTQFSTCVQDVVINSRELSQRKKIKMTLAFYVVITPNKARLVSGNIVPLLRRCVTVHTNEVDGLKKTGDTQEQGILSLLET